MIFVIGSKQGPQWWYFSKKEKCLVIFFEFPRCPMVDKITYYFLWVIMLLFMQAIWKNAEQIYDYDMRS